MLFRTGTSRKKVDRSHIIMAAKMLLAVTVAAFCAASAAAADQAAAKCTQVCAHASRSHTHSYCCRLMCPHPFFANRGSDRCGRGRVPSSCRAVRRTPNLWPHRQRHCKSSHGTARARPAGRCALCAAPAGLPHTSRTQLTLADLAVLNAPNPRLCRFIALRRKRNCAAPPRR